MTVNWTMPDRRSVADLVDQAIAEVRAVNDPEQRFDEACRLDSALATARSDVAQIKRDVVNQMRDPAAMRGYGSIAVRLGLTKGRVQQIANAPRKAYPSAYAFRDEHGTWHGEPGLLPECRYREAPTLVPFSPSDDCNPLTGQTLIVRYGDVGEIRPVSSYTLSVDLDGRPVSLRMTEAVQDGLFGPAITSAPECKPWEAAREQRRRELRSGR